MTFRSTYERVLAIIKDELSELKYTRHFNFVSKLNDVKNENYFPIRFGDQRTLYIYFFF